ncbi:MAG: ornithine decarboxylase [Thermoleophilia bacterium]|nr:ornithine decarboxylase [Thermoleophilia bacterium]
MSVTDPATRQHIEQLKQDALDKRSAEVERSPAQRAQDTVPFADAIARFWERDTLPFSIPVHIGGQGVAPEFVHWAGEAAARSDLPISHGLDRRDHSWQVLERAQQLFADAVGADQTTFVTNGSSMSVRVAIMTVAGPGDQLLITRNVHKSAVAGLVLAGIEPVWLEPDWNDELEVSHPPTAAEVRRQLDAHPEAKAVFIVSPDFYGGAADVRAIAELCHARDVPLVVDDAWGVDYLFGSHDRLPESPIRCGADLVIGSIHKSMTGLGQTSVIHVHGPRIDTDRLSLCVELEKSTSASALLLSSIDGARAQYARDGGRLIEHALDVAEHARVRIADLVPELRVVPTEELERAEGVHKADPTHILIEVHPVGLTGYQASDWLEDHPSVTFELVDHRRIMACVSASHTHDHAERMAVALRALVDAQQAEASTPSSEPPRGPGDPPGGRASGDVGAERGADSFGPGTFPTGHQLRTEQVMLPREAFFGAVEQVPWSDAIGAIAADFVTPYPPGVPVLVPGERITEPIMEYLQQLIAAGGFVEGTTDPSLARFRVVAQPSK